MGGHAAHAADDAGSDTAVRLVVRLVVADGVHQIIPFVGIGILLVMPSAEGLGFDRPGVLHPAEVIHMVDVKIVVASTAGPDKAVKSLNLPEQLAGLSRPLCRKGRTLGSFHTVTAQQNDV